MSREKLTKECVIALSRNQLWGNLHDQINNDIYKKFMHSVIMSANEGIAAHNDARVRFHLLSKIQAHLGARVKESVGGVVDADLVWGPP